MIALLLACSSAIVESEFRQWPAYDALPDHPPQPRTRELVREALPVWQIRSTSRDEAIASFVELHLWSPQFWEQLREKRGEYQLVLHELQQASLPLVFAGLAYQASQLESRPGRGCRAGLWMLSIDTPELVRGPCQRGAPGPAWSPGEAPLAVDDDFCAVVRCPVDLRLDIVQSTAVAVRSLQGRYDEAGRDALETMIRAALGPPEAAIAQHLLAACTEPTLGPTLSYCRRFGLPP
jgi:hypothetical protein